ncbi:MAG: signal peptidase II [Myxococcales bacterium]|nr:signal peptidase II [Myxococcales bacterium]
MDSLGRRNVLFAVTTVVWLLLDQVTKLWIEGNLAYRVDEIVVIPGFLSIVHAQNPGAAFGLLGGFGNRHVVFVVFTLVALWIVYDMFRKLARDAVFMPIALGLVLSGALGNAFDRARQQYVTDFIRVYTDNPSIKAWLIDNFGTYEWPSFNIADTALVIGVGMFVIHGLFLEKKEEPAPAGDAAPTTEPVAPTDSASS